MASSSSRHKKPAVEPATIPRPTDIWSFTSLMADLLRLPDETLATAFIYANRFTKYTRSNEDVPALDPHTLSLASLSLATKSTESPRRLREILLPAYRILHSSDPSSKPLTFPSTLYDKLRATLVQAELILLRILKFELRIQTPLEYIPRYLERTVGAINTERGVHTGTEDYDGFGKELKKELQVVEFMETGVGKACMGRAVQACKDYQLAILFPPRAVAVACVYLTLRERGLQVDGDPKAWVDDVTSGKVDLEDFQEAIGILQPTIST